jgi:hypothetical protein
LEIEVKAQQHRGKNMAKPGVMLNSLPDIYTHYRHDPNTGQDVPGRFLWTPIDPAAAEFDEPLVCNPAPTELLRPPPEIPSSERTLAATGLSIEPSPEDVGEGVLGEVGLLTLRGVCDRYYNGCTCRTSYNNNCAHYLSNAFILAGYSELTTSPIITARCPHRRPIRAQDMLRWFQSKQTGYRGTRIVRNTGIWATYQETSGWQHVVVIDTDRWIHFGTGDYHTWPVQWNYRIP